MKRYKWSAISTSDRTWAISKLNMVFGKYAIIHNFQRFSDISVSFVLEAEGKDLLPMYHALSEMMTMDGEMPGGETSQAPCMVMLDVAFTNATGDMEIEIPDIPE